MKKTLFAVALLSVCTLASCSNTLNGIKEDTHSAIDWMQDKPSSVNDSAMGWAPVGYRTLPAAEKPAVKKAEPQAVAQTTPPAGQPAPATPSAAPQTAPQDNVAKTAPAQPVDVPLSPQQQPASDANLVWHQISNYDVADPSLPANNSKPAYQPPMVQFNQSVDVFPVSGDMAPYATLSTISNEYAGNDSYDNAQVEQVYFPYGSAHVSAINRKNLSELAHSLTRQNTDYRLTVVGHASQAVDDVTDPLRRKIINFKMAQKRAFAVAHILIRAGAAPHWVEAKSVGATEPAHHLHGLSQQAADQRADVFLNAN